MSAGGAPASRLPWGAIATLSGEGFSRIALVVFQFLIANGLGAERYGTLGLVMSYAAVLLPLADLGLLNLALRHLANNPDPRAFAALAGLKLATTAAYLAAIGVLASLDPARTGHGAALTVAGGYWAFTSLGEFLRQCLRARESSLDEFRARLAQPLLFVPALLLFLLLKPGVAGTLLLWSLPAVGLVAAYLVPLRRAFPSMRPRPGEMREAIAGQGRFLAQSAAYLFLVSLSGRVELWLIDAGPGREAVGWYFAAYSMIYSGIFFGQALSSHMYARLHRPGGVGSGLARAGLAHAGLAAAMLLGILAVGEPVYSFIFRQEGFQHGAEILPKLGVLLAISVINYLWLAILIGLDRQWIAALGLVFIVGLKIYLGLRWIPDQGVEGMVNASLWAEIPASAAVGLAACRLYLLRRAPARGQA